MKIIGISTTTNEDKSSSKYLLKHVLSRIEQEGHDVNFIDANKLVHLGVLNKDDNGKYTIM
jgi:multimeric flavodoxin WrbA